MFSCHLRSPDNDTKNREEREQEGLKVHQTPNSYSHAVEITYTVCKDYIYSAL